MKSVLLIFVLWGFQTLQAAQPLRYGYMQYQDRNLKSTLPPNNLHLLDRVDRIENITEQRFNEIIDQVIGIWMPIAQAQGIRLVSQKNWTDSTVNAFASQSGKTWTVAMFGGLARRPEVTEDGFALVVCHELGHHFAGYSFYGNSDWASAEGQSDYFATDVCAKMIWGQQVEQNTRHLRLRNIPPVVKESCSQAWPNNANAQGWCVRAAAGGQSLATLLSRLGNQPDPQFETPDKTVVNVTFKKHPKGQCRLDTLFAGALCGKKFDLNVIPGKNHPQGQESAAAEVEAMKYSCFKSQGAQLGSRPACWFKPLN